MPTGRISIKGPLPVGRTNAQTLGAAAIRAMAKAGVGNPAKATATPGQSMPSNDQRGFDAAFAKAFNIPTKGAGNGTNQATGSKPSASAGRAAGKSAAAGKPGAKTVRVTNVRAPASKPKRS